MSLSGLENACGLLISKRGLQCTLNVTSSVPKKNPMQKLSLKSSLVDIYE